MGFATRVQYFEADTGETAIDLTSANQPSPEDQVFARDVAYLVAELPECDRELVRLHIVEERPLTEVGFLLGLGHTTTQSRARHAVLRGLRNSLSQRRVGRDTNRIVAQARPTQQRRPMPEPALTRSSLLALRASLEQRFDQSMKDIDAALRLLDLVSSQPAVDPTPASATTVVADTTRSRKPRDTNLGQRFSHALDAMPERFTKKDMFAEVERLVGREINRSTATFCVDRLEASGKIVFVERGGRGRASVYERAGDVQLGEAT